MDTPLTRGESTRQAILAAAYSLFVEQGFRASSMRQIAKRAGISLSGIYNHFESKEDIFVAIFAERHPFLIVLPVMQSAQGDTVEALVRDVAERMIAELGKNQEFLNLVLIEMVEFEGKHFSMMFEILFSPLMEFAQRFQTVRGPLRDIPLPTVLRSFLGLFFSYFITEMIIGNLLPAEMKVGAFDHFVDIYLHGILANPSEAR